METYQKASDLSDQLIHIALDRIFPPEVRLLYLARAVQGRLTRDENPKSHFCVYTVPFNPSTKKVFIGLHKKSGLWLAPGGHINQGELLENTATREVFEELSARVSFRDAYPFLLTITPIRNPGHTCRKHYDVWFRFPAKPEDIQPDTREFMDIQWIRPADWSCLHTDDANIRAAAMMQKFLDSIG